MKLSARERPNLPLSWYNGTYIQFTDKQQQGKALIPKDWARLYESIDQL